LKTANPEATKRFFEDGLGAKETKQLPNGHYRVRAGATDFELEPAGPQDSPAAWPGQFYVWVESIQLTWKTIKQLQTDMQTTDIIVQELCLKEETKVDVLAIRDPGSGATFVINQAPKAYNKLAIAGGLFEAGAEHGNLQAVMDVQCAVEKGKAFPIAQFYMKHLGTSMKRFESGFKINFAAEASRQTLTFSEDSHPEAGQHDSSHASFAGETICIYMPSAQAFEEAMKKCLEAGHTKDSWMDAQTSSEFMMPHLRDADGTVLLPLKHVIRSPSHPDSRARAINSKSFAGA